MNAHKNMSYVDRMAQVKLRKETLEKERHQKVIEAIEAKESRWMSKIKNLKEAKPTSSQLLDSNKSRKFRSLAPTLKQSPPSQERSSHKPLSFRLQRLVDRLSQPKAVNNINHLDRSNNHPPASVDEHRSRRQSQPSANQRRSVLRPLHQSTTPKLSTSVEKRITKPKTKQTPATPAKKTGVSEKKKQNDVVIVVQELLNELSDAVDGALTGLGENRQNHLIGFDSEVK